MNNIVKIFFLLLACVGLASCEDSVGYPDPGPQGNPEKEIAGTYTGTWTRVTQSTQEEITGEGSITFSPSENAFVTDVKVDCPDLDIDMQSLANVVNYSNGYKYYNQEAKNGFGVTFEGNVDKNGVASIKYTKSIKVGLKQTIYIFTFTGSKN